MYHDLSIPFVRMFGGMQNIEIWKVQTYRFPTLATEVN